MNERPPLRRSRRHRIFGGVCGGLAQWSGLSVTLVRFLYVLGSVVSAAFPGFVVYIVLWLVVPEEPQDPDNPVPNKTARNIVLSLLVLVILAVLPLLALFTIRSEVSVGEPVPVESVYR